ncbi:hypothetical protein E8E12_009511 [Didymella heteroderae]|uniref:Uncharacterized protein n=1 Tax=Didymella heteroderae TaxID=1769908 RepID=A0A9P5C5R0_9PLEO|nr:hypothetical protein E8E12_009511 [Didymella heteroderae]
MSIPLKTDFATRIMNAAIAYDTGVATPATEASHTDRIVELESQIAALAGEKKETDMRAMERYKNMLHATRHAERVELALEREKEDKLDSELKAVRCFRGLKQRIASLETDLAKAQGLGTSDAQFQELQTANTRLQAELAQEKEAKTQVQNTLKHIHAKFEVDKQQIKQQSKQEYEKIIDAKEKQGKADLAHQLAAATQRRTKEHEAARQEIECLKQQIQKLQQALDWHKGQLQPQPVLHAGAQGSPIAAGIHAGFPLSTQQSPSQVRDQSRKRRRLNSTGHSYEKENAGRTQTVIPIPCDTSSTIPTLDPTRQPAAVSSK